MGRGHGHRFVAAILDFALERYDPKRLDPTLRARVDRALKESCPAARGLPSSRSWKAAKGASWAWSSTLATESPECSGRPLGARASTGESGSKGRPRISSRTSPCDESSPSWARSIAGLALRMDAGYQHRFPAECDKGASLFANAGGGRHSGGGLSVAEEELSATPAAPPGTRRASVGIVRRRATGGGSVSRNGGYGTGEQ
jgi:hypothetical protein